MNAETGETQSVALCTASFKCYTISTDTGRRGWDGMGKVGFWVVLLEGILVFAIIFKLLEWFLGRLKEVKKK